MPSPYDVPSNAPKRFNRADAFAQYAQSQIPSRVSLDMMDNMGNGMARHPDSGMSDPHPDSSFVDSPPPVDGYKVPDAPSGGYDQRYAVPQGGGAGSMTRLDNSNAEGDYDTSFAGNQSEKDYLRSQYEEEVGKWRKKHRDMTMTNGAGQSFTMQQTPPSMLARAAKEKIEFMRSGKRGDMDNETARGNNQIAKDNAAAINDPLKYKLERQRVADTRTDLDQPRVDREAQAERDRLAVIKKAQDDEAERIRLDDYARAGEGRKLRPSVIEEQRLAGIDVKLADPKVTGKYRALLERERAAAGAKNLGAEAMAMATARPFDEAQSNIESSIIGTPILNAELESLKRSIKNASTRNGLATGTAAAADFIDAIGESITGVKAGQGAASGIGGALAPDLADVKTRFESMADMLVSAGVSPDKQQALQALTSMLGRQGEKDDNRDSKAGRQVFSSIRSLSSPIR